jgi:hypothetical protein
MSMVGGLDEFAAQEHAFETEEFGFILMTQPMVAEMNGLSQRLVSRNRDFMSLQIAPLAARKAITDLFVLMQFWDLPCSGVLLSRNHKQDLARQHNSVLLPPFDHDSILRPLGREASDPSGYCRRTSAAGYAH